MTYNAFAFGGGYTDKVIDGVLYRIMECDNIEMFANYKLHLAVLDSTFYRANAYHYDEAKADREAAEAYMETLFAEDVNKADSEMSDAETEEYTEVEAWIEQLTPENISEMAVFVEHTVQELNIDENGMLNVAPYEVEGRGGSGGCSISASWAFKDAGYGMADQFSYVHSGTLDTLRVETFTKNEDGTYTFAVYIPR